MMDQLIENNFKMAIFYALELLIYTSRRKNDEDGGKMFCTYTAITIGLLKEKGYEWRSLLQEMVDNADTERQARVFEEAKKIEPRKIDDKVLRAYFAIIIGMFPYVLEGLPEDEFYDKIEGALRFVACLSFGIVSEYSDSQKASAIAASTFQSFNEFIGPNDSHLGKLLGKGLAGIFNPYELPEKYKKGGDIRDEFPTDFFDKQKPSLN